MRSSIRTGIIAASLLFGAYATPTPAQVSISIGIHLGTFPELALVPGYPVYYAPGLRANYFFYDGLYWQYTDDGWYSSLWYDGPWDLEPPDVVPVFLLRIPVRYYRAPPVYFRAWSPLGPPHWQERWGGDWERRRAGWDHWDRRMAPAPAPLPVYQRNYTGDRYPRPQQQQVIRVQNYHYQPHETIVRQQFERHVDVAASRSGADRSDNGVPRHENVDRRNEVTAPIQRPERHANEPQRPPPATAPRGNDHGDQARGKEQAHGNDQARGNSEHVAKDRDKGDGKDERKQEHDRGNDH